MISLAMTGLLAIFAVIMYVGITGLVVMTPLLYGVLFGCLFVLSVLVIWDFKDNTNDESPDE